jgi:hypothetical protein
MAAALEDHLDGILKGESAAYVRRRNFTDAMADDRVGLDPPRSPQGGQSDLDGEDGGLSDVGLADLARGLVRLKLFPE